MRGFSWFRRSGSEAKQAPNRELLNRRLFDAVSRGKTDLALDLLKQGADVNTRLTDRDAFTRYSRSEDYEHGGVPSNGWTPLIMASFRGYAETVKALLSHGADVNIPPDGWTALRIAADRGHTEVARVLLQAGANIYAGISKSTSLHGASGKGYTEIVRLLLDHGIDVNATTETGGTALHCVTVGGTNPREPITGNHIVTLRLLLKRGANVNITDKNGCTALWYPAHYRHREIIRILQDAGIHPSFEEAVMVGDVEWVRRHLDSGVDVNTEFQYGYTAIRRAAEHCQVEVVRLLLDRGADLEGNRDKGWTPLAYAAHSGCIPLLDILCNYEWSERDFDFALTCAAMQGRTEAVRFLWQYVGNRLSTLCSALPPAVQGNYVETVETLLHLSEGLEGREKCLDSALLSAAVTGSAEAGRLLLEHGADANQDLWMAE